MKNIVKTTGAIIGISAGLVSSIPSANANDLHNTKPVSVKKVPNIKNTLPTKKASSTKTNVAKGIITAPVCNPLKPMYPNPGFTLKKSEIFTGTQYTTLKITFDKNITMQKIKANKNYKESATAYISLDVAMNNKQWGSFYYELHENKGYVYTMGSNNPDNNIDFTKVYSNVTFSGNIMRITFPRKPLDITSKTQYQTHFTYDYYRGEPNSYVPPYYTTECATSKY